MPDNSKSIKPEQSIIDGGLWAEFCDELKSAGEIVLQKHTPTDAFNRAEGFRYLTRLLRAGLDSQVESRDPHFPRFFQLSNETIKIGNDNPDNIYHNANIDGTLDYKITGERGTVNYLSFGTKAGNYATTGSMEPTGQLEAQNLELDENGNFEITVSRIPQKGNWLPLREDSESLIVRQTFGDRSNERAASYEIKCVSRQQDNRLDPETFATQLLSSAKFVKNTAAMFTQCMDRYSSHINQLPSDDQELCQRSGGDSTIHYMQSYWKLAPDEALLIHAPYLPKCSTWNFQLSNYWMESLDYLYHRISVNKHTATYNNDGSVTVVVTHKEPPAGTPNCLTTTGHDQGGMLWRWVEADEHPAVECRVINFDDLVNELLALKKH